MRDILLNEDTWQGVTQLCVNEARQLTQRLRQLKQQTHVSFERRVDLNWLELLLRLDASELVYRLQVYCGERHGRYEQSLTCTARLISALRITAALFHYGHVHGEDLYGRTIRGLTDDKPFASDSPDQLSSATVAGVRPLPVARVLDVLFDLHEALSALTTSPILADSVSERLSQLVARKQAHAVLEVVSSSLTRMVIAFRANLRPQEGQIWIAQRNRYALERFLTCNS